MKQTGALGVFSHLDTTVDAVRELRKQGFNDFVVQSPVPRHELLDVLEHKPSPVRLWTLIGGLLGCVSGFALTIWTSLEWPHRTSAKPIVSIPAFVVIAFELTILFGALATLIGLFFHARLPRFSADIAYDSRFSDDHFGIFIKCKDDRLDAAEKALRVVGAKEVRIEEG